MRSGPNAVYELTSEQFVKIIRRESNQGDNLVDELVADGYKMSAMQESKYGPHTNEKRPFSIPSAYYFSLAHKQNLMSNPNWYKDHDSLPQDNDKILPKFIINGVVDLTSVDEAKLFIDNNLYISRCTFKDLVKLNNIQSDYSLDFYSCVFEIGLSMEKVKLKAINVSSDFRKSANFTLVKCNFTDAKLNLKDIKSISLLESEIERIDLIGVSSESIKIEKSDIRKFYMANSNLDKVIIDGSVKNLNIGNLSKLQATDSQICKIKDMSLNWEEVDQKNTILLNNTSFETITISGYINSDKSLIKNVIVQRELCFENLNCLGKIKFHNLKIDRAVLNVINTDLGKSEFINVPFDSLAQVAIVDSKLSTIELTKCSAPNRVIGEGVNDHNGARDAIKQLRQAFAKSNDKIHEMNLIPLEYDEHLKSLEWKWRSFENNANIIVLYLNRLSNFHGQGVGRSIAITFLFSIISYSIYCLLLGISPGRDPEQTGKVMSFLLEYINPLHKPEYLTDNLIGENNYVSNYARAWEGFSKLIIAYLIYQFIQSFRKFGK